MSNFARKALIASALGLSVMGPLAGDRRSRTPVDHEIAEREREKIRKAKAVEHEAAREVVTQTAAAARRRRQIATGTLRRANGLWRSQP